MLGDLSIGEIKDVQLTKDYRILMEIAIDQEYPIPVDSKFLIYWFVEKENILDTYTRSIEFKPGLSTIKAAPYDTLPLITDFPKKEPGLLMKIFDQLLDRAPDSFMIELKTLNEQLNQIKKQQDSILYKFKEVE